MTEVDVVTLVRNALLVTLKVSAPILVTALVLGVFIGIIQTTTSIQEPTIAFVPKLIGIFIIIIVFFSWMVKVMTDYTRELFMMIEKL